MSLRGAGRLPRDVAIRIPAGQPNQLAAVWANSLRLTYSPKVLLSAMCYRKENGLPHLGDTSCVSFAPAFPPEKPGLKSLRCIAFSGPHRCAPVPILHRFARTPPSVIARREATWQSALLRQGIAESSTLGEYERGCEFARSGANLPGFSAGTRIATGVRTGSQ